MIGTTPTLLRGAGILKAAKDMVDADGKSIADKDFINDTRVQALLKSQDIYKP